jgi:tetratricopeptide (TPR) repeat protein
MTDTATIAPEGPARGGAAGRGSGPPAHVEVMHTEAIAAARAGRPDEAERLLRACVAEAPEFADVRQDLALMLLSRNRLLDAMAEVDQLLAKEPGRAGSLLLKAAICARLGRYEDAIGLYVAALAMQPGNARGWLSLGHALKTAGRLSEAIDAYRRALEIAPHLGDAWWSLADLKTVRFAPADVAAMQRSLRAPGLAADDHCQIHFALGKAHEDLADYATSFAHYAQGARLRRRTVTYSANTLADYVRRAKALFTPAFFAERAGQGCDARDPIFIVGLPRAGSTLIEQILASHSQVEGVHELPELLLLAGRLAEQEGGANPTRYPHLLADLSEERLRRLGEEYLAGAGIYRGQGRPVFVDKMPENFMHLGLIHLILPNAKVIDARRHPLGCGFSVFKQHFARGHTFANDLADIGRHYADYVELMAHFDAVLPGRVHRVIYERLVADPEAEIRRLLDHCGLPFEAGCLSFHANERAVRTPSSEQVRRPIFTDATDHWRNYDRWLDPLKASLGPVLEAYPDPPPR